MKLLLKALAFLTFLAAASSRLNAQSDGERFHAAFERYIKNQDSDLDAKVALFKNLANNGTPEEIQKAIWEVLEDPSRRLDWANALDLAFTANIPRKDLVKWLMRNLKAAVTVTDTELRGEIVSLLGQFSDESAVTEMYKIANQLPADQAEIASFCRETARQAAGKIGFHKAYLKNPSSEPPTSQIKGPAQALTPKDSEPSEAQATVVSPESQPKPKGGLVSDQSVTREGDDHLRWVIWSGLGMGAAILVLLVVRKQKQ